MLFRFEPTLPADAALLGRFLGESERPSRFERTVAASVRESAEAL
jgi:hypothetical protein